MPENLVTTDWLEEHLDDPSVRVLEIGATDTDEDYRSGHVPGAIRFFWKDLSWHETDRVFVTPAEMAHRLGSIGIRPDATLVIYSDKVQYGTYAYWALTMAGHKDIKLLDGSRTKWVAEGRPLSLVVPVFEGVPYEPPDADISSCVGRDDVLANLENDDRLMLDVRSLEEYSGKRVMPPPGFDHGAERTGRIPGAVHLFYQDLVNDDDTFLSPDELRAKFGDAGAGPDQVSEVVSYCRLSHRATLAWVAATQILGWNHIRIYDGSWTEWGSIVGFPIEK
ncbi:MAG TPA: sulfurtransferase [Dehalococcoidia bacterium]|jgi:thiosulfate/3-mercaptopyruvate sulfurtransferase|nr:sulfurtransferase [Chloroflexota bacterium]MDP6273896.1 sulfurtransferase [Dehalococcoidia bacterium]MDP7212645.1 sulfurtransferase [Dehalococcoidia bacterium]MDP7514850.1 sulfurtransferase [Dehalococcoidia bacterium]HJM52676.1 sulfurtransferase [Dehalococcoidia bacterium]|tara:strand:+ start:1263 stop:2099 length:837 start_codon:yes stop_codon:yes gene_type:complete